MANKKVEKKNRVIQAIHHEWKYENLILVVLALFAIELGVLLLTKALQIADTAFLIGEYADIFAWVLVVLGVLSMLLAVSSFYKPSFAELKHVTGLKKRTFLGNVLIVIVFCVILAFLFIAYEAVIELAMDFIKGLFK